jgi:hypothetical protein
VGGESIDERRTIDAPDGVVGWGGEAARKLNTSRTRSLIAPPPSPRPVILLFHRVEGLEARPLAGSPSLQASWEITLRPSDATTLTPPPNNSPSPRRPRTPELLRFYAHSARYIIIAILLTFSRRIASTPLTSGSSPRAKTLERGKCARVCLLYCDSCVRAIRS